MRLVCFVGRDHASGDVPDTADALCLDTNGVFFGRDSAQRGVPKPDDVLILDVTGVLFLTSLVYFAKVSTPREVD